MDGDLIADGDKWVDLIKCIQKPSLLPSIPDGCGDTITSWNIPFTNWMGYYEACRKEFSMCQKSLMHEILENLEPDLLVTCQSDSSFQCADIIIDTIVIWTNDNIIMCRGQKIIIEKSGSLTLNNTTITIAEAPDPPSSSCSGLGPINLWDGIYIQGKSVESNELLGNLIVLNNSVIEFAENGINAPIRFGKIILENSTIQHCGKILDARDIWPYSTPSDENGPFLYALPDSPGESVIYCGYSAENLPSFINIRETTISCDPLSIINNRPTSQIKVVGTRLNVNNSILVNNTNLDLIAINHGRGKLTISNGTSIEGFKVGIDKSSDSFTSCFERGLIIAKCTLNNTTDIINSSAYLSLNRNKFNGDIRTHGICFASIVGNNFLSKTLDIRDPLNPVGVRENYFDGTIVELLRNNSQTLFGCNIWNATNDFAVDISNNTQLPMSWGTFLKASGNKRTENQEAIISNYSELIYHFVTATTEATFEYVGNIEAKISPSNQDCLYDLFPDLVPPDSNWTDFVIDINEMEEIYDSIGSIISQLQDQYNLLSGQDSINKLEEISLTQIEQGEVVGTALTYLNGIDSLETLKWLNRADPLLMELSDLQLLWYRHQFDEILIDLQNIESDDADVFTNAVSWMQLKYDSDIDIFSLSVSDLDTLKEFAEQSFGNYTNILRSFLKSEYDIHVSWPEVIIPRSSKIKYNDQEKLTYKYQINPNPSKECITISSTTENGEAISLEIFNIQGQRLDFKYVLFNEPICLTNLGPGIFFVRIYGKYDAHPETHLLVKN